MNQPASRRSFLGQSAAAGMLAGVVDLGFLAKLAPVSAADAQAAPKSVQYNPEIEPLVRLIEQTPRGELLEVIGRHVRDGLPYQQLLTGLFLAAIRTIEPRPFVGFKFHGVLVVNAAHMASLASAPSERWLPIFWALDYYKQTQAEQVRAKPWAMPPVDESAVPPAHRARQAYIDAMDRWDEAAADAAIAGLARSAGAGEIYELLYRYGVRDFHDFHHAIYTAYCRRLLDSIGWQHAEPVLRALTSALMNRDQEAAKGDAASERPWMNNQPRAAKLRADWLDGRLDDGATRELLATIRQGSADDAAQRVAELSASGIGPQSIWDGLLVGAAELLMCQRGIPSIHAVTTANALHYLYQQAGDDTNRRMAMLQCASFVVMYRDAMAGRGKVFKASVDDLEPAKLDQPGEAAAEILRDVSGNPQMAARKMLTLARERKDLSPLIGAARTLVFFKGNNPHDYKLCESVFEDYRHVSSGWRDRFLAASAYRLIGPKGDDNPLVARIRTAVG